jgi:ParB-like chromosome segregation protein Spo0J
MSKVNFAKLVRNIERTGRYEPLIVRPKRERKGSFEIINGEHRRRALAELGHKRADCIVWDVNDEETDILLLTLNQLGGRDGLDKKLKLFGRLKGRMEVSEAARFLPARAKQIERLLNLKMPRAPVKADARKFAEALVFFVSDEQKKTIEKAITSAAKEQVKMTKAGRRAEAMTAIAENFLNQSKINEEI